jgi:hypothetical protein
MLSQVVLIIVEDERAMTKETVAPNAREFVGRNACAVIYEGVFTDNKVRSLVGDELNWYNIANKGRPLADRYVATATDVHLPLQAHR